MCFFCYLPQWWQIVPSQGPVRGTQLGPGLPFLWGLRTPQPNPRSHASHRTPGSYRCVYIFVRVCLQMWPLPFMWTYKAHRHQVWKGFSCWLNPERKRVRSAARQRLLLLGRLLWHTWAHAWTHMYALLDCIHKQHLKTYFTYFTPLDLNRATREVCLIFSEKKTDCFWKLKWDAGSC